MTEARGRARLVESARDLGDRGVTATVRREEVEEALRSHERPELFLDVARASEQETRRIAVDWEREDLGELLRTARGDEVVFHFDQRELEQALEEPEVEGHGLRERALVLTVAATAAAGIAGQASARHLDAGGGAPAPIQMVSDAATSASQTEGLTAQQIWDSAPQSVRDAAAPPATPLVSDSASSGAQGEGLTAKQIWDSAPASTRAASAAEIARADRASRAGGVDISAPSPEAAGIASGVALLILGAGFSIRGQRRRAPRPT